MKLSLEAIGYILALGLGIAVFITVVYLANIILARLVASKKVLVRYCLNCGHRTMQVKERFAFNQRGYGVVIPDNLGAKGYQCLTCGKVSMGASPIAKLYDIDDKPLSVPDDMIALS
mgnify:CR=1 FL=1